MQGPSEARSPGLDHLSTLLPVHSSASVMAAYLKSTNRPLILLIFLGHAAEDAAWSRASDYLVLNLLIIPDYSIKLPFPKLVC